MLPRARASTVRSSSGCLGDHTLAWVPSFSATPWRVPRMLFPLNPPGYAADHSAEPPSAATVTVFRDPRAAPGAHRRAASCVSWHPDGASKAAVSYSILGFQQQPPGMAASSYVFDVASPNAPESELAGLSQLVCARFNLKDGNVIGAGQYNGQFSLFDTRKGPAPVETTPIDICHRSAGFRLSRAAGLGLPCAGCSQVGSRLHRVDGCAQVQQLISLLLWACTSHA